MKVRKVLAACAACVLAAGIAACGDDDEGSSSSGGEAKKVSGKVGVELPLLTSPFWQSYNNYVPQMARSAGVEILPPVNADSEPAKQITDIQNMLSQGVKGLVVSPLDSAAIGAALNQAERKDVPVVAVDVAPDKGKVEMVVRADNRAYGQKACKYIGDAVKSGKVLQIMGDLASINGRDRSEAFRECMQQDYPDIKVLETPAEWKSDKAAAAVESIYTQNKDLKAIYMQAGGVYLAPTLQTLKRLGGLHKAGSSRHIVIVSNDGIPQEYDAIRKGEIDATVSQPADLYARYGIEYIKRAMAGETFKAGPTDHDSEIVKLPSGNLEDRLPAPLVTKENVDDPKLWGNTLK
jgi:simple sugar transport system substrate-binding protein/ribose transport system substrate-binding protein